MDFTIKTYNQLLNSLIKAGFDFQTFTEFLEKPADRVIMLRHDVDDKKLNSLHFAKIQNELGIKGTYYFRMVSQSYDDKVISEIADLGHEIGYHYEDMDFASSKLTSSRFGVRSSKLREEDLFDTAIEIFEENLATLRKLYPVKTICMHGSPRSPFDNKALWKKYDYKNYGIIGEPYFDIDFNEVFYLTDTGRMWDGQRVSIRDKVNSSGFGVRSLKSKEQRAEGKEDVISEPTLVTRTTQPAPLSTHTLRQAQDDPTLAPHSSFPGFHATQEIINAAEKNELPDKIMFTFHPQRWNDAMIPWAKELVMQNIKNQVKRYLIKKN